MTTIRDVAKLAGVSLGTVSNVMNGNASVSEDKRSRVADAIAQLGYRRNQAASQLRSNRSNAIGLVLPDITNPFYPEIARGVDDSARKAGFSMFLCNKDRSEEKEERAIEALLEKNVDGIVLMKPKISKEKAGEILERCPLVLLDTDPALYDCDVVCVNDYEGVKNAVNLAYELGHREIAYVSGLQDSFSSTRRIAAFQDTVRALALSPEPRYIEQGDFTADSGKHAVTRLMSLHRPPTAIIAANDQMAVGVIAGAQKMGIRVPDDVSVIGYDDIPFALLTLPCLTTVWHPKFEMGAEAVRLLLDALSAHRANAEHPRRIVTLDTQLRVRESLKKR